MACPVDPDKYEERYGLDALDALFCFGYRIVKESPGKGGTMVTGHEFRLCSAKIDRDYLKSIGILLKEVSEAEEYYKKRLVQEGRRML